jgi:hypothetical protein
MWFSKRNGLLLILSLYSSSIFANDLTPLPSKKCMTDLESRLKQGHVVLELGGYLGTVGNNQHINITSLIGDNFTVSDRTSYSGLAGLGYFIDGDSSDRFKLRYGINAYYLVGTTTKGYVIQENLFSNLTYNYNVSNFPIYAMVKSDVTLNSPDYAITVNAGIGPNFMHLYNFAEKSADGGVTIPDQPFSSNTTANFSATIGAGLLY